MLKRVNTQCSGWWIGLLLLPMLLHADVLATDTYTSYIVVRVRDNDNAPLSGIAVSINGPGGVRAGTTDSRGVYSFKQLEAGTYEAKAFNRRLGASLPSTVQLAPGKGPGYPTLRLRAVRMTLDGRETGFEPVTLLDRIQFKYLIMGDSTGTTSVRVQGRLPGTGTWFKVGEELGASIQSGNTIAFVPRRPGVFECRVVLTHLDRNYYSQVERLTVQYPDYRKIMNASSVEQEMKNAWVKTRDFADAHRGFRKEHLFYIRLNTATGEYLMDLIPGSKQSFKGDYYWPLNVVRVPNDVPRGNEVRGHGIYTVGVFHSHTPFAFAHEGANRKRGPSEQDRITVQDLRLPAYVYDYVYDTHPDKYNLLNQRGKIFSGHPLNGRTKVYSYADSVTDDTGAVQPGVKFGLIRRPL